MDINLEQIMKMNAGFEMDEMIAEIMKQGEFKRDLHELGEWNYSSDSYFALKVFDEICNKGYLLSIQRPKANYYMISINFHEPIYVSGKTMEEAICRTALLLNMIGQEREENKG